MSYKSQAVFKTCAVHRDIKNVEREPSLSGRRPVTAQSLWFPVFRISLDAVRRSSRVIELLVLYQTAKITDWLE